jgi:tetratricopeptide (TPR) repeat protein
MLKGALGRPLPRRVVTRIAGVTGGNPFFALELARSLAGRAFTDDAVALPDNLRALVAARIAGLPPSVRLALLAVAASRVPTVTAVAAGTASSDTAALRALEQAEAARIVRVEATGVRFAHPLFAAGVYAAARSSQRLRVHARLAAFVDEPEERARHLALASTGPDAELARVLDEAAELARCRGAPEAAAELVEEAHRLTPPRLIADARRRAIHAADYHFHAGELTRARALLDDVLRHEHAGRLRAEALRLLAEIHYHQWSMPEAIRLFEEAIGHAGTDLRLRSSAEGYLAFASVALGRFAGAEPHARRALTLAEQLRDEPAMAQALAVSVIVDYLLGRGLDELRLQQALAMEDEQRQTSVETRPSLIAGAIMLYEGRLNRSRELLLALHQRVLQRGEDSDLLFVAIYLVWADCLRGDLATAASYAEQAIDSAERVGMDLGRCWALAFGALQAAYAGDIETTRARAEQSLNLVAATGFSIISIWARWALAILALSPGDPRCADTALAPLTATLEAIGIEEPIRCMFLADHIEALIGLGELDRAQRLTDMLEQAGRRLDRGWVLHQCGRCRALLLAAHGDIDTAARVVDAALDIGRGWSTAWSTRARCWPARRSSAAAGTVPPPRSGASWPSRSSSRPAPDSGPGRFATN